MKNDELNYDIGEDVLPCPSCEEEEVREYKIIDTQTDEIIDTGDYICDNPDCNSEFRMENNKLI